MVPPPLPLTRRQKDALQAVENHVRTHGWAPTYAELAGLIGAASTTSAVRLVEHLESKGWIDVEPGTARGIRILHSLKSETGTPGAYDGAGGYGGAGFSGDHPAAGARRVDHAGGSGGEIGWGRVAQTDEVWIPHALAPADLDLQLTRVPDNGMVSCGILIGDFVVWYAVPVPNIRTGDLVVCPVHDRRTIRRARCMGDDILLVPDDALYATTRYDAAAGPLGIPLALQRTWPDRVTIRR